mmetsp:Transcript_21096/g.17501  ORF Transcript_21096/g.17501 Transcript_21096/m.17501 type:complete len:106 (-) Transcript_21096:696-1013(-)
MFIPECNHLPLFVQDILYVFRDGGLTFVILAPAGLSPAPLESTVVLVPRYHVLPHNLPNPRLAGHIRLPELVTTPTEHRAVVRQPTGVSEPQVYLVEGVQMFRRD